MADNIVLFPPGRTVRQPIAEFIRLGDSGHVKLAVFQSMRLITELNELPDLKRTAHFVAGPLADCASMARRVKDLKPSAELTREHNVDTPSMMNRLTKHSQMKGKIHQALEHLLEELGHEQSRSKPVQHRIQRPGNAAGKGGKP